MSACLHEETGCIEFGFVERDWRDDRIEELEALVARLMQRVAELEAQLAQFSGNSSRPPSSDPPGAPPPSRPKRTGRRRGGQRGHEKHTRALVPPEQVDKTQTCKPKACRRCGKALAGNDPDSYRHQTIEVPKVKAIVEEFQLHALKCETCGITTRATLPPGAPTSTFGPRLQALVAVLSGAYRLSKRAIDELVGDTFGVPIVLGSVSNLEQATSEAIAAPVEEIARVLQNEPIVHMDETGWFEQSKRAWLWIAVTARIPLFAIRHSRGAKVAKELLGTTFSEILISDRWSAYAWVDVQRRQLCWAHLLRQFLGFQTYGTEASTIGRALELLTETMFHLWHRVRDGTMTRKDFQNRMERLRSHVVERLREGAHCSSRAVAGRCREILELEPALWTFVHVEGVEPTNNVGERRIRHGVMWRKTSFGTDSPNGSQFVARILTVVTTLRIQKRNVLDYMTEACEAALHGRPAPSLLRT